MFPRGAGAATGPVPSGYTQVSRWMSPKEAEKWIANQGTHVPTGIGGQSSRVYVTSPGMPRPGGAGPVRVDFSVPQSSLQQGGQQGWHWLPGNMENTPIYNVGIYFP